jgi:cytidylate kinase
MRFRLHDSRYVRLWKGLARSFPYQVQARPRSGYWNWTPDGARWCPMASLRIVVVGLRFCGQPKTEIWRRTMSETAHAELRARTHMKKKKTKRANDAETAGLKVITIDGPAGSGKSTVASLVARFLGWTYVTTGAIYRTLGWMLHEAGVDESNALAIEENVNILVEKYIQDSASGRVYLGELDITDRIRTPEASERASLIAQNQRVRDMLLPVQRKVVIACNGAVVDGRDMGTVVFPEAPLKIFLTADPAERARRRALELKQKGEEVDLEALVKEIHERDLRDANRAVAPMRPAENAIQLDCTSLSAEQVAEVVLKHALERGLVETSGSPM